MGARPHELGWPGGFRAGGSGNRKGNNVESDAFVYSEIDKAITDQVQHQKIILSAGVGIEIHSSRVLPQVGMKTCLGVGGLNHRLHFVDGLLGLVIPETIVHDNSSLTA